ncbi:MAG: T9SS type A sorting domain-containing protein [Chitinophagales bacterium]|nr:T9SS type A sorting domain-containing protein [Chitinophagales bacterium]
MNKHLLPVLLTIAANLLFLPLIKAQSLYEISEDEKISHSTVIIEGKVVDQVSFWNPAHSMIFTSSKVEVFKVFKGDAIPQYIEILTQGGSVGSENIEVSDLLELSPEDIGVFYCYQNTLGLRSPGSNEVLFDVYSSSQGFLRYNPLNLTANAPFVRINNIESGIYDNLEQKLGNRFRELKEFDPTNLRVQSNRIEVVGISSFSPTTVNAGATLDPATNLLTIDGTGFGTASGSAAVLFDDANDGSGGSYYVVAYNDPLMVSWSTTQIQVRVPSRAGTGTIIVRDNTGVTGNSATPLTVNYSILTATFTSGSTVTKESNLMNANGSGGYTVLYSTSTAGGGVNLNAAVEKATFQRALSTLQEVVGYNVVEGGTTTLQAISNDGNNVIMFDNTNTGVAPLASGVLAVCYSFNSMCTPVTTNQVQKTGFDIIIRNAGVSSGSASFTSGPCPPASSSLSNIDLETVLLHELGHSVNLGHINDSYQGSFVPNLNPGKLMNYAIVNSVKRSSLDYSAYQGALYAITPQGNTYGTCGLFASEMIALSTTTESKDECPVTFPTTALANNTSIVFDLVHATSNKFEDPQYTALNCAATGTGVTNTAYYAFKTAGSGGGSLLLTVTGYSTTPSAQASCTPVAPYSAAAGVELALYAVSSCPTGQSFPAPVACRTFNSNGALSAVTGLSSNTTYLLVADGIENTKANFTLTFGGTVLPISILSFTAEQRGESSYLQWQTSAEFNNDHFDIETSKDGVNYYKIGSVNSKGNSNTPQSYSFIDQLPSKGINYYRLKQTDIDTKFSYSRIITLTFNDISNNLVIYPVPATNKISILFPKPVLGADIAIYNAEGRLVLSEAGVATERVYDVDINRFNNGVYIIDIRNGNERIRKRIIKQEN